MVEEHETLACWVDLFTRDMIAILGIFGNIILIMIRMQKRLRNTFNKLLVALAFFDIFTLIIFLAVSISKTSKKMFHVLFPYFIWPFGHIAVTGSMFMTVVIAYERFLAVHKPLNFKRGQRYRVVRYVTFVIITTVIINAAKFFEYEPDDCNGIRFTKLYENKIYSIFNIVVYKLMLTAFTMSALIYLYAQIYCDIKASHTTQARQSSVRGGARLNTTSSRETVRKKESKQAGIFAGVVIAFLVCHIPDDFVTIVHVIKYIQGKTDPPLWFLIALKIRDIFVILKCSLNIVIHTCLSKQFREDFLNFITCKTHKPTISANANSVYSREMSTRRIHRQISLLH